ncbi:RusA family crossover junction endodeoxyribonuclease [Streptomyces sp. H27-C3]|uniref:RusA family crossover junction endodeoxyribonuclease n=1 Tax=Streptomyces sp. H27-C3 TaxID=3046305 RepID=UPI0024BB85A1|nr:RusA family crossover junction endodeoxyribonuclease [Streptomyces sp. H27-C3]MDJ0466096.1 RusA family crossover junction endodeoxyribonuclease [Streptomyces sp. H27-C3]
MIETITAPTTPPATLVLEITVIGTPAGQGALSNKGGGRMVHSNHDALIPWRTAITQAATRALGTHQRVRVKKQPNCRRCGKPNRTHGVISGPVAVQMVVTMERSEAAAKRGDLWPANRTTGDSDHHARAVLDALCNGSVYPDDGQVVVLETQKVFSITPVADTLPRPGAVIRVYKIGVPAV